MAETAHLFKLKTDDAYIIASRPDLESYAFPDFDEADWENRGLVELSAVGLREYAHDPEQVIKALREKGYFLVHPRDHRWIKEGVI